MQLPSISGYQLKRLQGSGLFGHVYEGTWNKNLDCAIKVLDTSAVHMGYIKWCLERLRGKETHPNVAAIYGFDVSHSPPYFSSRWAGNSSGYVQTLESCCGKWPLDNSLAAIKAIGAGLAWLHEKGIIHTGLTARNVLLPEGDRPESALITDIGQGCITPDQTANWNSHIPYFSPERLKQEASQSEHSGESMDVYAFGVVAFRLMTGRWPRSEAALNALDKGKSKGDTAGMAAIAKQLEREPTVGWGGRAASPEEVELRRILEKCLAVQPSQRYAHMQEALQDLEKVTLGEAAMPASPELVTRRNQKTKRHAKLIKEQAAASRPTGEKLRGPKSAAEQGSAASATAKSFASKGVESAGNGLLALKHKFSSAVTPGVTSAPPPSGLEETSGGSRIQKWISAASAALATLTTATSIVQCRSKVAAQSGLAKSESALIESAKTLESKNGDISKLSGNLAEAQKSQANSEANLRDHQLLTGKLFDSLLDLAPTDKFQREAWKESLISYGMRCQQFLEENGKNPALRETAAIVKWHLGAIALGVGDLTQAEQNLKDATSEIDAILAARTGPQDQNEWLIIQGKIHSRSGRIFLDSGRSAEATQSLAESVKAFDLWMQHHPDDALTARERISSLELEARALQMKGDGTAAIDKISSAAKFLDDLMQSPARRADDVILLAQLLAEKGDFQARLKKYEDAQASFFKAHETLRDFDRKHPKSTFSREVLAAIYARFGAVMENTSPADASVPYRESITLLAELLNEDPSQESYCLELGRNYLSVGRLVRLANSPAEAVQYTDSGILYLRNLCQRRKNETRYKLHLAIGLAQLAELHEDSAKWLEAVKAAAEADEILNEPGIEAGASPEEHREATIAAARALTTLGHGSSELKKKEIAKESFQRALEAWQRVLASGDASDKTRKSMEFVEKSLQSL